MVSMKKLLLLWPTLAVMAACESAVELCPGGCPAGLVCDPKIGRCVEPHSGDCPVDQGRWLSLAADSAGNLWAAFYDAKEGDLIVARWLAGVLNCERVDGRGDGGPGEDVGLYASAAVDGLGRPWVAYFDRTGGKLKIARMAGGGWQISVIPRPSVEQQLAGRACRLRLDGQNLPHVAYFNEASGRPEVARQLADGRWTVESVYPSPLPDFGGFGGEIGRQLDLVLDASGQEWVFFEDPQDGALRAAGRLAEGWKLVEIEPGPQAAGWISAELDPAGNPAVLYHHSRTGELVFAANREGALERTVVDDGRRGAFGRSLAGVHCVLIFGSDGLPRVLYLDGAQVAPYFSLGYASGTFSPPWPLDYNQPAGFFPQAVRVPGALMLGMVVYGRDEQGRLAGRIEKLRLEEGGGR